MRRLFALGAALAAGGALAALAAPLSACPAAAGYVHDTFEQHDDAWTRGVVGTGGGFLRFPLRPNTVSWAVNHVDYHTGDATVCTDVKIDAAHAPEEEAGLAFWMVFQGKTPSFYTFTVSPSGRVSVADRRPNGSYATLLRKTYAAVRRAPGAKNELLVVAHDGLVRLSVNGHAVGTISSKGPDVPWYAGVFAISPDKKPAAWQFTEFSLTP